MRALMTGTGAVTVVVAVVLMVLVASTEGRGASSQAQGVMQLQHSDGRVVVDTNAGGIDVKPRIRPAAATDHSVAVVDATLLEDITFLLIQSEARAVREQCRLLGNWFGYVVQFTLGAAAFAALFVKRFMDRKPRDWMTWFRDTSKQAVGSLVAHMWNLLFATLLQSRSDEDPCVYYLITYLVDAVLGCALSLLMLWGCEKLAEKYSWNVLRSGDYGGSGASAVDVWRRWAAQCGLWLGIVTISKLILLFALVVPAKHPMYIAGAWLMSGLVNYPRIELVIVMIVIPFVCNIIQFWITDNWLMNNDEPAITSGFEKPEKDAAPVPGASSSSSEPSAAAADNVTIAVPNAEALAAEEEADRESLLGSDGH